MAPVLDLGRRGGVPSQRYSVVLMAAVGRSSLSRMSTLPDQG